MVRFRRRVSAAIVAGSAACVLVACGDTESPGSDVTLTQTTQPATTTQPGKGALKRLPNLAGKGLQTAQDEAQAAGFSYLTSHDALGRGRNQVLDRNWKVCAHFPAAGQVRVETEIDFATVKLEEKCPAKTGATGAPKVDRTMLNFVGKSVKAVRDALPFSASIDTTDARKRGRTVFVESNWRVCTQKPVAGTKYRGQPVTLTAVKYGERCP